MTAPAIKTSIRTPLAAFVWWHEAVLFLLLAGLLLYAGWFDYAHPDRPPFVDVRTQLDLSSQIWELALVALPMALIIMTAGIDLSVGSIVALCAVVLGKCYEGRLPLGAGIVLALLTGTAAGAVNGFFISRLRVHPLIVTLATLAAYRGIAVGISAGRAVSGFPERFLDFAQNARFGITAPGFLVIGAAAMTAVVLGFTPFGRALRAMGFNEAAARFSGIPNAAIKLFLYSLSGLISAVAAVIYVSRFNTAKADLGSGLELQVITAVVLGGVSIFGGRGTIAGVLLGVLLIHVVQQLVPWQTNRSELNLLVIGALLIGSVLINSLLARRRSGN